MADIRYPSITANTVDGQIKEIRTYLHQLVNQLNFAIHSSSQTTSETSDLNSEQLFQLLKDSILTSSEILNVYTKEIKKRLSSSYVTSAEWIAYKTEAAELLEKIGNQAIDIDTELSDDSQNPVENKAIKKALDQKADSIHTHQTGAVACDNTGYWWGTSGTVEDALMSISSDLASLHSGLEGVISGNSGSLATTADAVSTNQQGGTVEQSLAGLWGTKLSTSSLSAEIVPFAYSGAPSVSTVADALKLLFGKVGL